MNNPLAIFRDLRELYRRYLDSPLAIRYDSLRDERRSLLFDQDRRLWREPLIEPVPTYPSCGAGFTRLMHDLLDDSWGDELAAEVGAFLEPSLFTDSQTGEQWQPFAHQQRAFQQALVQRKDVVVTTGTGSGKTECFLVPVLAELVRESRGWPVPGARSTDWDWWDERHRRLRGRSQQRQGLRVAQREHEGRPAAVRALLLYPLNALVEDQLVRLRVALDSAPARGWLDRHRDGNRFYFGRYTGRTPIPGNSDTDRLRKELREMAREAAAVADSDTAFFFQSLHEDGAEMWSRWDMQSHPPDLLITNYSMLNIMLMRRIETAIFDATNRWLAEGRRLGEERIFHLIVDELHTYRGTSGTEVAYLLRVLLDRLGLSHNSEQVRIIASSASLEGGNQGAGQGREYLQDFFARSTSRFSVVDHIMAEPSSTSISTCAMSAPAFRDFGRAVRSDSNNLALSAIELAQALELEGPVTQPEQLLREVVMRSDAGEALRSACWVNGTLVPQPPSEL